MNLLALAISWNSHGVKQMKKGDNVAALASFDTALDTVLALEQQTGHWIMPHNVSQAWQLETTRTANSVPDENGFLFFDQCFVVTPCSTATTKTGLVVVTRGDVDLLTATLLFNLALAYTNTSGKQSEQVARLFQTAFDVMGKVNAAGVEGNSLRVALCNNIASLALDRQDYYTFETHRSLLGIILRETKPCFSRFFAGNFATTCDVRVRPAAAA